MKSREVKKMDIDPTAVEQMAREYKTALDTLSDDVYERLTVLEEEQLDLLNDVNVRSSARLNRTVNYLKNLIFRSLSLISSAAGNGSYIPSVRSTSPSCNAFNRINALQLDIFVLLDKLTAPYSERAELAMLENRKAALLALIS